MCKEDPDLCYHPPEILLSDEYDDPDIDAPSHYTQGKIEVYDFLRDQDLPYPMATAVAYICRCRWKGTIVKDLKKARWYIDRCIEEAEAGEWSEDTDGGDSKCEGHGAPKETGSEFGAQPWTFTDNIHGTCGRILYRTSKGGTVSYEEEED